MIRRYIMPTDAEMNAARLARFIDRHREDERRLSRLLDFYESRRRVDKGDTADGRPDNQVSTNLAKYITDTATGYFVGVPPLYTFDDEAAGTRLSELFDREDETSVNYAVAEDMSIFGVGYGIVWIDENADIRLRRIDPRGAFIIRADTIDERALYGVRYYRVTRDDNAEEWRGELYDGGSVQYFTYSYGRVVFGESAPHYLDGIPITEYPNNGHYMGDFEPVIANIDGYNLTLSNATDDLQSIANAYLAIVGMMGTEPEDIAEMNKTRIALLTEGGQMQFITKNLDSAATGEHLKRLRQDVLQVAGIPDLSDESFSGNVSGVALRYKLWALDQLFGKKKAYMERGLFNRLRLISGALRLKGANTFTGDISMSVSIKFTQNMPRDNSERIDSAVKLAGIVSNRTIYEQLEAVTEVSAEDELDRVTDEETAPAGAAFAPAATGDDDAQP